MYIVSYQTGPVRQTLRRTPVFMVQTHLPATTTARWIQYSATSALFFVAWFFCLLRYVAALSKEKESFLFPILASLSLSLSLSLSPSPSSLNPDVIPPYVLFLIPSLCFAVLFRLRRPDGYRMETVYVGNVYCLRGSLQCIYGVAIIVNCCRSVKERSPYHKFRMVDTDAQSNFYSR